MPEESWTLDTLVEAYRQHQRRTRGLREQTLRGYVGLVRPFIRAARSATIRSRRSGSARRTSWGSSWRCGAGSLPGR